VAASSRSERSRSAYGTEQYSGANRRGDYSRHWCCRGAAQLHLRGVHSGGPMTATYRGCVRLGRRQQNDVLGSADVRTSPPPSYNAVDLAREGTNRRRYLGGRRPFTILVTNNGDVASTRVTVTERQAPPRQGDRSISRRCTKRQLHCNPPNGRIVTNTATVDGIPRSARGRDSSDPLTSRNNPSTPITKNRRRRAIDAGGTANQFTSYTTQRWSASDEFA